MLHIIFNVLIFIQDYFSKGIIQSFFNFIGYYCWQLMGFLMIHFNNYFQDYYIFSLFNYLFNILLVIIKLNMYLFYNYQKYYSALISLQHSYYSFIYHQIQYALQIYFIYIYKTTMNINQALSIGSSAVQHIICGVQQEIRLKVIGQKYPLYLHHEIYTQIYENLLAAQPNHNRKAGKIKQQHLNQVPKLSPDTLMPKYVQKQKIISPNNKNQTNRSSFLKLNKRSSISNTLVNSINFNEKKSRKSLIAKNNKVAQLIKIPISLQEVDDPEYVNIRNKKQMVVSQDQKFAAQTKKRNQQLLQKSQKFQQDYKTKDYTYSFEGEVLDAKNDQGALPYYSMRLQLGRSHRKKKEGYNNPNMQERSIELFRKKQTANQDTIKHTEDIPLFQPRATHRTSIFGVPSDLNNCKKEQYKKYFGGKFHRLDRSLMNTIDITQKKENKDEDDLFNSQRFIKDSESLKQSIITQHLNPNTRKLALPKLNGIYKVLDRYQGNV